MALSNRYKTLFSNMGWMTVSEFSSNILVFLLVPFYTRMLTTEEYGLYDMCHTVVILCLPLLTSNIAAALMRYALAEKESVKVSFSVGIAVSTAAVLFALLIACIIRFTDIIGPELGLYALLTWFIFFGNVCYCLLSQFMRGIERMSTMAIGAIISSACLVALSVFFLVCLRLGVVGYFLAMGCSMLTAALYMAIREQVWRYLCRPTARQAKTMMGYGMPLAVNNLAWWVNNFFGRYLVTIVWSVSLEGILAAAYKIPAVPKTIQQIFIQAWQISAIKEFGSKDCPGFFSSVYNAMMLASSLLTSVTIVLLPLAKAVMFSEPFYGAIDYVPVLMLSVVFNCLASVVSGVYTAVGDSKPMAMAALWALGVTVVSGLILVPLIGAQGAAISSSLSSATLWLSRLFHSRKYLKFEIRWKESLLCFGILAAQIAAQLLIGESMGNTAFQLVCTIALAALTVHSLGLRKRITAAFERKHHA